ADGALAGEYLIVGGGTPDTWNRRDKHPSSNSSRWVWLPSGIHAEPIQGLSPSRRRTPSPSVHCPSSAQRASPIRHARPIPASLSCARATNLSTRRQERDLSSGCFSWVVDYPYAGWSRQVAAH